MAAVLCLSGCDSADVLDAGSEAAAAVPTPASASSSGSFFVEPGFYFLPPMVQAPSFSGTFDAAQSPVVEICESPACEAIHAVFTVDGNGSTTIRVDEQEEHYIVNWNTRQTGAQIGQTYRLRVSIDGTVVGHADIGTTRPGAGGVKPSGDGSISIFHGSTLPVKFRIEEDIAPVLQVIHTLGTGPPNNGSGGVFIDLTPNVNAAVVSFDVAYSGTAGTEVDVEVWTRPGSYVGFESNAEGWTLTQTVQGTRMGQFVLSALDLSTPIHLAAGETTAIYLHAITAGGGIRYTGTAANPPQTTRFNDDMTLFGDIARSATVPFAGNIFSPRTFAGNVNYVVY